MSAAEDLLAFQVRAMKLPAPQREARLIPKRKFRWDFYWGTPYNIVAEVQGQIWKPGAHSTGKGITRDAEKLNQASLQGLRSFFFTTDMVMDGRAVETLRKALNGAGGPS